MNLTIYCIIAYLIQNINAEMLGPGIWSLIGINECPDEVENPIVKLELNKHKVNRTHDGLSVTLDSYRVIDDTIAALVEICKYVDGGCKQYQILSDENAVHMFHQYAGEDNIIRAFTLANVDPPEFPLNKGKYELEDYVFDYCQLPRDAIYGKYEVLAYFIIDGKKVSCVKTIVEFNKFEEYNFCDL